MKVEWKPNGEIPTMLQKPTVFLRLGANAPGTHSVRINRKGPPRILDAKAVRVKGLTRGKIKTRRKK